MRHASSGRNRAFTLIELLVAIAILAILIGLMVPAVQKVRAIAARIRCINNLKQIALGMHACHDAHNRFPPGIGFFPGKDDGAYGTGLFHLLPYVEQDDLYKEAKANDGTWTPYNNGVYAQRVPVFFCPSDPSAGDGKVVDRLGTTWGACSYAGNVQVFAQVDPQGALVDPSRRTKILDIQDGTSNTIMFAEHYALCTNPAWTDGGNFWAYQQLGQSAEPLHPGFAISWNVYSFGPGLKFQTQPTPFKGNCDPTLASTPHSVMMVGMCDGSVHGVSPSVSGNSWWAACTPNGREVLPSDWYN
jgi:prepilin-type N-terminal cleavage/methylation domain-containing protein